MTKTKHPQNWHTIFSIILHVVDYLPVIYEPGNTILNSRSISKTFDDAIVNYHLTNAAREHEQFSSTGVGSIHTERKTRCKHLIDIYRSVGIAGINLLRAIANKNVRHIQITTFDHWIPYRVHVPLCERSMFDNYRRENGGYTFRCGKLQHDDYFARFPKNANQWVRYWRDFSLHRLQNTLLTKNSHFKDLRKLIEKANSTRHSLIHIFLLNEPERYKYPAISATLMAFILLSLLVAIIKFLNDCLITFYHNAYDRCSNVFNDYFRLEIGIIASTLFATISLGLFLQEYNSTAQRGVVTATLSSSEWKKFHGLFTSESEISSQNEDQRPNHELISLI